jgi:hypothetical protein
MMSLKLGGFPTGTGYVDPNIELSLDGIEETKRDDGEKVDGEE